MKIKAPIIALLGLCAYASQSLADDDKDKGTHKHQEEKKGHDDDHDHDHDHDHDKIIAGPNGGRVLTGVEPHLEFYVTDERMIKITALNDDNKAVAIGEQSVKVVAGDRRKPTRLKFEKKGDFLISDGKLPEGNDFPVVIQIKPTKRGKSVNEKFNLNLEDCPTCDNKEYACTCDHHGHGDEDDHDHEKKSK